MTTAAERVRTGAARIVSGVLTEKNTFDDAFSAAHETGTLKDVEPRDRAFARLIAVTTMRRLGQIDDILSGFLSKPLDHRAPFARAVLQTAVAQMLFLDTPPHAVIDSSVKVIKSHRKSQHFAGLTNAVLRRISEGGAVRVAEQDAVALNTPAWMFARWKAAYGSNVARSLAEAHLTEPTLDLTPKTPIPENFSDLPEWATAMDAEVLATGSVRLAHSGRIEALPGFDEGAWWVQDAAAALPARLLGDVRGQSVLDICAAPGGKTAQLAAAGATVTALDVSKKRMERVTRNLKRLDLKANLVIEDAITWAGGQFDAILLDAPCSATGTIRRHPDLPHLKSETDIVALANQQQLMLQNAFSSLKPGGQLVFCTCSLEPEEGAAQIASLLAARDDITILPLDADADAVQPEWITEEGFLRTWPFHAVPRNGTDIESAGIDGFFAARLRLNG